MGRAPLQPEVKPSFHALLLEGASRGGFPLAGALDLDRAADELGRNVERYDEWLGRGFAGAMDYLVRGRARRADPRLVLPGAASILCVGIPYPRARAGSADESRGARYARYLQGPDYHRELTARLEGVMESVAAAWTAQGQPPFRWKVCVDTSAVLERGWAALAGLGWIGKNSMLIHPRLGSYLFLASALIDLKTGEGPRPLPDYCGGCRRCLDGCPTGAFAGPRALDSRRCISYWTLEKRGPLELSLADRKAAGTWVAGCDVCQEVCPFNLKPVRNEGVRSGSAGAPERSEWRELLEEDEERYRARVADSSLKRVKPAQFSRNLALGIASAALRMDPPARRGFAAEIESLVAARHARETDEAARAEWTLCLEVLR